MIIYAIDDEPLALNMLTDLIKEAAPQARLYTFSDAKELLHMAEEVMCDVAFMDIELCGTIDGMVLAEKLRAIKKDVNIVFVTAYEEYTRDALALRASGYLLKPVTIEKIKNELADLRYPVASKALLRVQCFGNFDVFHTDGTLFKFERAKSKELFAYLIYKRGTSCTTKELAAILFENSAYDDNQKGYIQKIISTLMLNLRKYNLENVVQKQYNNIRVNTDMIQCDYYDFLTNSKEAKNAYHGEFMKQYSWAETTVAYLDSVKNEDMRESMKDAYSGS